MNEGIQAVDDMIYASAKVIRITVDAAVVVLRLSGHATKQLLASALAHLKSSSQKEMGEVSVKAMVKRGEPFDMIAVEPADATKFQRLAEQTGLLYSIHADKPDYDNAEIDGLTTILYRQQDAPLVNSILQQCQINTLASIRAESYPDAASPTPAQTADQTTTAWANQSVYFSETTPSMTVMYDQTQQPEEDVKIVLDLNNGEVQEMSGSSVNRQNVEEAFAGEDIPVSVSQSDSQEMPESWDDALDLQDLDKGKMQETPDKNAKQKDAREEFSRKDDPIFASQKDSPEMPGNWDDALDFQDLNHAVPDGRRRSNDMAL